MDHQQQMQQTEKIIIEMLEFLETSSDEENDLDHQTKAEYHEETNSTHKDINGNILLENIKSNVKIRGHIKKGVKSNSNIANELIKLQQQLQWNANESVLKNKKPDANSLNCKINSTNNHDTGADVLPPTDFVLPTSDLDWQYELENQCRRSYSNSFTREIYKAIYQDTTGHPPSGSADYYQAAQNYALYGKHFVDFPDNLQVLLNDKNSQSSMSESSNLINFGNCLYAKPNTPGLNFTAPHSGGLTTTTAAAASAAAYYQICNSLQTQTRPTLSANPSNATAYGIFLGNKVTYVGGTPTTPPLICNQHSTTTNFISNSLANAALATSPTILYTNPMLTTTTQQYLTQFLSTAALTTNSTQSVPNASGAGIYERLIYAQLLQQQFYQTQQAAAVAAMFQHKQRVAATARQTVNVIAANTNRSSPQHATITPTGCITNRLPLTTCNGQARCSSPSALMALKPQSSISIAATESIENSKSSKD